MTGWQLVVALLLTFGGGYGLASWRALIRTENTRLALYRRALAAGANTDHSVCHEFMSYQEWLIDLYRADKDVGNEAEEYLRDGGS